MPAAKETIFPKAIQVVLFVSDKADVHAPWESPFQEKGLTTVHEALENAVHTCKVVDPALTVVDTTIPHTKRLEFCLELRSVASGPILLLVSDYDGNQMNDIYSIGVDECLLKPVSPAFLVVKAISWLLRRRWLGCDTNLSHVYTSM